MQLFGCCLELNKDDLKLLAPLNHHRDIISILTDLRGFLPVGVLRKQLSTKIVVCSPWCFSKEIEANFLKFSNVSKPTELVINLGIERNSGRLKNRFFFWGGGYIFYC